MSEYYDIKNNYHAIIHRILTTDEDREEAEREIVEELYRIFA